MLQCFGEVAVNTLFFQGPDDTLHLSVPAGAFVDKLNISIELGTLDVQTHISGVRRQRHF